MSDSVFEIDAIARAYFSGRERRCVNSGALVVLLDDALQDLRRARAGGRVERNHDAALVLLDDGDARAVAQAQNAANPIQFIEGRAALEIHEQIGPKTPRVRPVWDSSAIRLTVCSLMRETFETS